MGVQLFPCHPSLDAAVHVRLADVEHPVHPRQVQGDAATDRGHVALQRGSGTPGHHRDASGVAQRHQPAGFLGGFDERDGIRQDRWLAVLAVRVVIAQAGVGGDAVAEKVSCGGDDGFDRHGRFPDAGFATELDPGRLRGKSPVRAVGWSKQGKGSAL
jgi:hypothetical protein